MPNYLYVSFFLSVLTLSWFGSSVISVRFRLPLFLSSMAHFSMANSILMSWLYIPSACIRVSSLMSSLYIRWLIFSCDLLSLYSAVHFLSMCLSGIEAIMDSNGDSASSWNEPHWIFASAKLLPPAVISTLLVFMVFSIVFRTSCDILYILRQFIVHLWGTTSYGFIPCKFLTRALYDN